MIKTKLILRKDVVIEKNIDIQKVCQEVGLTDRAAYPWYNGKSTWESTAQKICKHLNMEVNELFERVQK